jgi:type IV pilus assembly protein PilB
MPSINPEISVKISTLLKNSGKISEANFSDAKKSMRVMARHLLEY